MQQSKHIETTRTARYFTLGNVNNETKGLWMVLHGYAQNGDDFLKQFSTLANEGHYVVSVEAMSRFYAKGFYGNIAASWMTRDDREADIKDNTEYLWRVYEKEFLPYTETKQIHLLGFSQGATTLSRFVSYKQPLFHHLWICAGDIPDDMNWENFKTLTDTATLHIMLGKQDPLIDIDRRAAFQTRLHNKGIQFQLHEFEGVHEVNIELIKQIATID
jgi:predicted esterase